MAGLLLVANALPATALAQAPAAATAAPATAPDPALARLAAIARTTAAEALGRPVDQVAVRAPDPRLRPPDCPAGYTGRATPGTQATGRVTVEVRCLAPAWRVFLPAVLEAREAVWVAARPVPARTALTAADLQRTERQFSALPPTYLRADVAGDSPVGWRTVRPLAPGDVLGPGNLRPALAVRRGQQVQLVASNGGFSVSAQGEALADAAIGDRVKVRNLSSRREVEGVVTAPNTVSTGGH